MEHENDIYWHALNFRTAATQHADQMWQELYACVKRLITAEREACAKIVEEESISYENTSYDASVRIRERSNVELSGSQNTEPSTKE